MSDYRNTYGIWVVLPRGADRVLGAAIRLLSRKYGTEPFKPHLTLVPLVKGSRRAIMAKAKALSAVVAPFDVRLGAPKGGGNYYSAVFINIRKGNGLARAHSNARKIFGSAVPRGYAPHISLVYGSLGRDTRKVIISGLDHVAKSVDNFTATKIAVYSIVSKASGWKRIAEFSLMG